MPVHSRFDPSFAGGVVQNAHPNVYVYPWIPTQQAVRSNPLPAAASGSTGATGAGASKQNYGTRTQRVQPHEKKSFFQPRGFSMGASSDSRTKCCGSCGNGDQSIGHQKGSGQ